MALRPILKDIDDNTWEYTDEIGSFPILRLQHLPEKSLFLLKLVFQDNRFNPSLIMALNHALDYIEGYFSTTTKSMKHYGLLTMGQDKFFSNGIDLKFLLPPNVDVTKLSKSEQASIFQKLHVFLNESYLPLLARFLTFPMPTLALINGHAYAGGLLFALAHDYRIVCNHDKIGLCMNEVKIGLPMEPAMVALLQHKLNQDADLVQASLLTAKRWSPNEALKDKLVHSICDMDDSITYSTDFLKTVMQLGYAGLVYGQLKTNMYFEVVKKLKANNSSRNKPHSKL